MTPEQAMSDRPGVNHAPAGLSCFGATDVGKVRSNNEDAFIVAPALGLCVVADGMGGLARGEVASQTVVDTVRDAVENGLSLPEALRLAHRRIRALTAKSRTDERMGATAVAAQVTRGQANIAWVGDSRGYRFRDGQLSLLTRDHSFVQELLDRGTITTEEAANHPNKSVVTRALGVREIEDVQVDEVTVDVKPGDRLLLCSDGLCGYLPDASIAETLAAAGAPQDAVESLVRRTLAETDAADNLTVIVVSIES